LRVALVGCGRWGANIARDLLAMGVRLEIADPVTGAYASLHELPACDSYVVATPSTTHVDILAELLPFGKPIFCEKPLGTELSALQLLPAASHDLIFVMDKWRYHPAIEKLGRLAVEGTLGAIHGVTTHRLDTTHAHDDVDCTWILLPHELSIAREILGRAPVATAASASFDRGKIVGLVSHLRAGDAAAVSTISTQSPARVRTVEVAFAEGGAAFDLADDSAIVLARGHGGNSTRIDVPFAAPLRRELEAFVAHAAEIGPPPKASFADGVETIRAIELLRELAGVDPALPGGA
jgi:predicted dehydrogenase